ncbi:MAG: PEGA domain-containing protein [Bradymonadaceae bacterium]
METFRPPVAVFLSVVLVSAGCASSTRIMTDPEGAEVYVDGAYEGKTPLTYKDQRLAGTCVNLKVKKSGYETQNHSLCRDERANVGAIIAGIFFWFPFMWMFSYKPSRTYKLVPSKPPSPPPGPSTEPPNAASRESPPEGRPEGRSGTTGGEEPPGDGTSDEDQAGSDSREASTGPETPPDGDDEHDGSKVDSDPVKAEELRELKKLHDEGILTDEEYQRKKEELLE